MPIFDQGYQHWEGALSGGAARWLAITRHGVRTQWKNKYARWTVFLSIVPALVLATALVLYGLLERKSTLVLPLLALMRGGLPEQLQTDPAAYRTSIWTLAFYYFYNVQTLFYMSLVLIVGPDLISQDLRFNALPLYLSRPLRRSDYFLGKLGVIGVYIAGVTILPVAIAYALGVGFSLKLSVAGETARLLGAGVLYGLVVIASAGTLMLALSSLSKNARLVGASWFFLWFVGNVSEAVLSATIRQPWCHLVSYVRNLRRLGDELLGVESAWGPIERLFELAPPNLRAENPYVATHPWAWSAYVLAGLFGLSLCILSLRVRTLDRLR